MVQAKVLETCSVGPKGQQLAKRLWLIIERPSGSRPKVGRGKRYERRAATIEPFTPFEIGREDCERSLMVGISGSECYHG